ncbi:MAG TPA: S8 family serine peptidase [Thermoanaerobaculia bacterium]|nr:S8 family serine peptidase [Thermoanaerobaculia bacterium]
MSRSYAIAVAVVILAAAKSAFGQPARLESIDPLTQPPPVALRSLTLPQDTRQPEEKIVPRLWVRLAKSGDDEQIPIIIELHMPQHRVAVVAYSADWDREQAELSAAAEHRFVARAAAQLVSPRGLSHFPIVSGVATRSEIRAISGLAEVYRIYEDEVVYVARAEGGNLIKANTLRTTHGGNGSGIGIAVLDTGVDDDHPELSSRIVAQGDYTGTTGDGTIDDHGHGTAAAGIIAGTNGGMAPQASLWAIKVLKADGQATATSVLEGLNAIYAARAEFGGLDVVNMSLGGVEPFNSDCDSVSPFNSLLNALHGAGIDVFVASGNNGFVAGVVHPACHSKVVAVGAVYDATVGPRGPFPDAGDCLDATTAADRITCYSNSGNPLDVLAPADCARTPAPGGGYENCFNGTSAASPYAAGVAAQILSLRSATTPAALRLALMTTGRPLTDVNGITRNRIDAVAALQALGGGANTDPCVRDGETACLVSSRFEVEVDWQSSSASGDAQVMSFNGQRAENNDSAFFWFFSATNFEMGLKILDACVFNGKFWVFISGLTDRGWTVRIRDTQTGATKTYSNPVGRLTPTTADTTVGLACP